MGVCAWRTKWVSFGSTNWCICWLCVVKRQYLFLFFVFNICNLHARRLFDSILAVIGDGHVRTLALAHHAISSLLLISASKLFLIHAEVRSSYYHTMSYKLVTEQQFQQICGGKTINQQCASHLPSYFTVRRPLFDDLHWHAETCCELAINVGCCATSEGSLGFCRNSIWMLLAKVNEAGLSHED